MSYRRIRVIGVPVMVAVFSLFASGSVAAQSTTPWGDPDIQGIWHSSGATPMERPSEFEGRETLSNEEVAEIRAATIARNEQLLLANAQRTQAGGNVGAYNNFWMERGVRSNRTSMLVDPPDGQFPPLTPAGELASETRLKSPAGVELDDTWQDRHIWERCVTRGGMPNAMFPRAYNNNMQVFQAPGYVVMLLEQVHELRVVPLDGRPSPEIPQWHGEARGHWDHDTLVVESTSYTADTGFRGATGAVRLTERFTRVGPDTIHYEITADDSATWTSPWTLMFPMAKTDQPVFEYACHEGNYGLENILRNARLEDLGIIQTQP